MGVDHDTVQRMLKDQQSIVEQQVSSLYNKMQREFDHKLEWYHMELQHWKERCEELEIDNLLLRADFSQKDINLEQFDGRTNFKPL